MKTFVPNYYKDFKCIASLCQHSCCVGWEIDIDDCTLEKYNKMDTELGKKIRENIETQDGVAYFKLKENERCPFLNSNNLCELILEAGEDTLCDICKDHPRFRNFYTDRTEMGLGIACEEATRIILSAKEPFSLDLFSGESEDLTAEEISFIEERNSLIKTVEEVENVFSAINKINEMYELKPLNIDFIDLADFLLTLEMLDLTWTEKVKSLKENKEKEMQNQDSNLAFKNLYKYFLFRHLTDDEFYENLAFAEISTKIIFEICKNSNLDFSNICEIARMYSSEIEYSDENKEKLIEYTEK